jgi:hypothetical protein
MLFAVAVVVLMIDYYYYWDLGSRCMILWVIWLFVICFCVFFFWWVGWLERIFGLRGKKNYEFLVLGILIFCVGRILHRTKLRENFYFVGVCTKFKRIISNTIESVHFPSPFRLALTLNFNFMTHSSLHIIYSSYNIIYSSYNIIYSSHNIIYSSYNIIYSPHLHISSSHGTERHLTSSKNFVGFDFVAADII